MAEGRIIQHVAGIIAEEALFRFHENPNPSCPVGRHVHDVLDDKLDAVSEAMRAQLKSISLKALIDEFIDNFRAVTISSAVISVSCFLIGMMLSCVYSIPTGAGIVGVNLFVFLLCSAVAGIRQ